VTAPVRPSRLHLVPSQWGLIRARHAPVVLSRDRRYTTTWNSKETRAKIHFVFLDTLIVMLFNGIQIPLKEDQSSEIVVGPGTLDFPRHALDIPQRLRSSVAM
jgi:hypothetical protein